jgi:hypothetical protein
VRYLPTNLDQENGQRPHLILHFLFMMWGVSTIRERLISHPDLGHSLPVVQSWILVNWLLGVRENNLWHVSRFKTKNVAPEDIGYFCQKLKTCFGIFFFLDSSGSQDILIFRFPSRLHGCN